MSSSAARLSFCGARLSSSDADCRANCDPHQLARDVLDQVRHELRLSWGMGFEFVDIPSWGEYDPKRPTLLRLSTKLLRPHFVDYIPYVVAHEAMHAWRRLRALDGSLMASTILDADANEQAANDYGHAFAKRWRC